MNTEELASLLSTQARIYDLEQPRYPGMPAFGPVSPGLLYFLYRHHENYYAPEEDGPRTSSSGLIIMTDQSGTHIDAMCHQASDMTFQGNVRVTRSIETPWGFQELGAEHIPPIIRRAVLVDATRVLGDPVPDEHEISGAEFRKALDTTGVEIHGGDVVLVRTGFGKHWNDASKYMKAAGVSKEASLLLKEKGVFAVGCDNLAWDVPGKKDPETKSQLPGHLDLLARSGIYIMENLNLEELARERVYTSLFIGLPLKFKGATGSPFRPISVVLNNGVQ